MPIDLTEVEEWMELPELSTQGDPRVYSGQEKRLTDEQLERVLPVLTAVWSDGERHALALSTAGSLAKSGYTMQDACNLVSRVCLKAGDTEIEDRLQAVRSTYQEAAQGRPVRAWLDLASRMGPDTLEYYRETLGVLKPPDPPPKPPPEIDRDDPYKRLIRLTKRLPLPSHPMLIENWLPSDPRGVVGYLAGRSQSFKSFLALDWACHVSLGMPWCGMPVSQAQVAYIYGEGQYRDLMGRLRAWETHHGRAAPDVYGFLSPINLMRIEDVADAVARFDLDPDIQPRLIIFDTLSQCSNGMDENSSHDAKQIYHSCKEFGVRYGATVLVVHHTGKSENAIMRGASALFDDADFVHSLVRPGWEVNGMDCTLNAMKIKSRKLLKNFQLHALPTSWADEEDSGEDLVLTQRILKSQFEKMTVCNILQE